MNSVDKLLEENIRLVKFVLYRQFSSLAGDQDLEQEGLIGLWKACLNYDGREGVKFSTYAIPCIRYAMLTELRKRRRVPNALSIDAPLGDSDSDFSVGDLLVDEKSSSFEGDVFVEEFMSHLSEPDRHIVELRGEGLTHKDIGPAVGTSQVMVPRRLSKIKILYRRLKTGEAV